MAPFTSNDVSNYLPIGVLLLIAITFAIVNVVASGIIGPRRQGAVKGTTYESGMNPLSSARKRFNVRFYLLAMAFLVFDVEIIFLFPWAATFAQVGARSDDAAVFLGRVLFFLLTTVIAYVYAAKKGVFRFD